jgi:hypothetical protein
MLPLTFLVDNTQFFMNVKTALQKHRESSGINVLRILPSIIKSKGPHKAIKDTQKTDKYWNCAVWTPAELQMNSIYEEKNFTSWSAGV